MLSNYIKVAFRSLLKRKVFSIINIFGLAMGMSVCMLIIMLIKDANSFDDFHPDGDRIYRILTDAIRKNGEEETYASSPYVVGKELSKNFSQIEKWVPLVRGLRGETAFEDKQLMLSGLFTEPAFFEVFGFELALGDPAVALSEPYSIILTPQTARKFFGQRDPLGASLEIENIGIFKVSGVLAENVGKTHLEFEALGSIATLENLEKQPDFFKVTDNWKNYYTAYNFVLLNQTAEAGEVEAALAAISSTHYRDLELETRDAGYRFRLQALNNITPGPLMSNSMGRGLPAFLLWFLSILGVVIVLSACFNYTNLTLARAFSRSKEIGVRKVMGASQHQIFRQITAEAILTTFIALILAYQLMKLIIPAFNQLQFTQFSDVSFQEDIGLYGWFLLFTVGTGLVAGFLPGLALARVKPLTVLQSFRTIKLFRHLALRKVLIVLQFTACLVFLILVTIAWRQMDYTLTMDYGFDREHILNVELQGRDYQQQSAEFLKVPAVENISAVSHLMGSFADSKEDVRTSEAQQAREVRDYYVDHRFVENMGLTIVAGENFPPNVAQQRELFALVNERFLEEFQMGEPPEAIGKQLILGDSSRVVVRGIVQDFLYKPLNYSLEPLLLRYDPGRLSVMNVKISGDNIPRTIATLEQQWEQIDDGLAFQYRFYDDVIRENYANVRDLIWIVSFFALMGIVIGSLGLLGMAIYTVETKAKEISIRKVIGAGATDITILLSRGYLLLLMIAIMVSVPLGFFLGKAILQTFAFHIKLNAGCFLPAIVVILLIGIGTISSQTIRAALANPVDSLRNE